MTGSVTNWIHLLQAGDQAGAQRLFERYFDQLVDRCQAKLAGRPPRAADGEDVAQQALASFFRRAEARQYPDLQDRDGLWKLLLAIASNKAKSLIRYEGREKRGGGKVVGENVIAAGRGAEGWNLDLEIGEEPTPEIVAGLADTLDEFERRLPSKGLREIAQLKLAGYENAEIARQLHCSVATVERRLQLIRDLLSQLNELNPGDEP